MSKQTPEQKEELYIDDEFLIMRAISIELIGSTPKRDLIVGLGPDVLTVLETPEAKNFKYVLYIPNCFIFSYVGIMEKICAMKNVQILTNSPHWLNKTALSLSLGKNWSYRIDTKSCIFQFKNEETLLISEDFFQTADHVSTLVLCIPNLDKTISTSDMAEYFEEFDEDAQKCLIYDTCISDCVETILLQ